jgi:transposase
MGSIAIPVGIDVSKDTLDVFIARSTGRKRLKVRNDEEGIGTIVRELQGGPYRLTLEATGRYEALARHRLEEAGFEVIVQHPRLARHLAIGLGVEAKTDPIDAENLALTATVCKRTMPRSEFQESLGDISRTISMMTQERSGHKKRLDVPGFNPTVAQSLRAIIADLDEQIRVLKKLFDAEVRGSALYDRYKLIMSVPSVGAATSRVFTSELPEDLSGFTPAQICSHAGLTPLDKSSGASMGHASLKAHGNMFLKAATYMPAITMLRLDAKAKRIYSSRCARGLNHQQAIVPVMHMVADRIAAVAIRGSAWQADPPRRT